MPASSPLTLIRRLAAALALCPLLALAQAPLPPLAAEVNEEAETPPPAADTLPLLTATVDGRTEQIPVEDLSNPMVLIETTRGGMLFELFPREAPETVANFLGLADGSKPWIDPYTQNEERRPFYDGLTFYRVVNGALIQGGSPTGDAQGYPGYFLPDEINAASLGLDRMSVLDAQGAPSPVLGVRDQQDFQEMVLKPLYDSLNINSSAQLQARLGEADQKLRALSVQQLFELRGYRYRNDLLSRAPVRGVIAMASNEPNQNGSQFFITLTDADWLLGRHTVFGKIRAGLDVLDAIGRARVNAEGRPQPDVTILSIRVLPR
ncbi:MAG: peptidylprolyl isomerase [Pseudomonadales bacterium]|jgi:peptidyl-prolyl cis-trans isomerase A (cyclophilin A)|nr:peptidylprolyl isomerase [Pseudomonadales bacterium]